MENILIASTVISAIVVATTSLIKSQIPNNKYLPVINVMTGILVGAFYALSNDSSMSDYIWGGFIAGLSAGGFYDLVASHKDDFGG